MWAWMWKPKLSGIHNLAVPNYFIHFILDLSVSTEIRKNMMTSSSCTCTVAPAFNNTHTHVQDMISLLYRSSSWDFSKVPIPQNHWLSILSHVGFHWTNVAFVCFIFDGNYSFFVYYCSVNYPFHLFHFIYKLKCLDPLQSRAQNWRATGCLNWKLRSRHIAKYCKNQNIRYTKIVINWHQF